MLEELRAFLSHRRRHPGVPPAHQDKVDLYRYSAGAGKSQDGQDPYQLQPDADEHRPAFFQRPQYAEYPGARGAGGQVRQAFIAPDGRFCFGCDYSQIDLRVLAHLSQDDNLVSAFRTTRTSTRPPPRSSSAWKSQVTTDMRRFAKTVNFGVIYGMSDYGLEQATELSREEAGKFITAYFEKYPGREGNILKRPRKRRDETGYVQTLLGRRRYIPDINSSNRQVQGGRRAHGHQHAGAGHLRRYHQGGHD